MKKVIFVDIDETICITPTSDVREYAKAKPIKENIEKINKFYEEGNKIIYWTARGSRSGINWYDLTKKQLESWGALHHELRCDKPYYDVFVEDRSVRIEEL
jgi:histidinol phosphatase-like enzyme